MAAPGYVEVRTNTLAILAGESSDDVKARRIVRDAIAAISTDDITEHEKGARLISQIISAAELALSSHEVFHAELRAILVLRSDETHMPPQYLWTGVIIGLLGAASLLIAQGISGALLVQIAATVSEIIGTVQSTAPSKVLSGELSNLVASCNKGEFIADIVCRLHAHRDHINSRGQAQLADEFSNKAFSKLSWLRRLIAMHDYYTAEEKRVEEKQEARQQTSC